MAMIGRERIVLVAVLLGLWGCGVPEHEQWTEQVTLHDGREVTVTRGAWQQWLFDGVSGQAWRYRYSIKVLNPDSGKSVRWAGRWSEKPIIVEFDQGRAYVVFVPEKCDVDMTRYGDPNPPYVVMRRADGWLQRWKQVRLGFVQSPIPHDWESWSYPHKLRDGWGCAEKYRKSVPDPGHPQSPVQPSQEVPLEVLETRVYEPQWIAQINASDPSRDWNVIAAHDAECRSFLKSAGYDSDRPDLRGWLLFVKDPTGNKKARNAGALLCDAESLWFVDYYQPEDRSHVSVVKFTNSGDFRYRLRFARPDAPRGYLGSIMGPTFRNEGGFLYFEWWNFRHLGASEGGGVQIERSMKVRLREPAPAGPSN